MQLFELKVELVAFCTESCFYLKKITDRQVVVTQV